MTAGDHVGTEQAGQVIAHDHGAAGTHAHTLPFGGSGEVIGNLAPYGDGISTTPTSPAGSHSHAPVGGDETRPVNYYAMPIIKY